MEISAALVKELRERTGSGMMECKKALQEVGGNLEAAVEHMRKAGLAKADKKASRIAAEGMLAVAFAPDRKAVVMVEVNCETDFVAKGDDFKAFANEVATCALQQRPVDAEALLNAPLRGAETVNQVRQALVAKIGENLNVRRLETFTTQKGVLAAYLHGTRIGVLVELEGGDEALARDVAMHVAASRPVCVGADDVPADLVAKEREIATAQAAQSGKPANIVEKMVDGKIKKFLAEVSLLGQPFVKNPDLTVEKLLAGAKARCVRFARLEVGAGIEKKKENFADEVMAQVRKA